MKKLLTAKDAKTGREVREGTIGYPPWSVDEGVGCVRSLPYLWALVGVTSACRSEHPVTCAPIGDVTEAVVRVSPSRGRAESIYSIRDSTRIRQLVAFANSRRSAAQPSLYTMPAPSTTVGFYKDGNFLGALGRGPSFLFVSCPTAKGLRDASDVELQEFEGLIEPPK